ncbi:TRAP transporter substrate-binding protein DctP [Pelagibius sp.]|uniref:TRAP transporter substrate-binding protein DctP n=1 Tax=Pelagibius sp. TaxID=1931238 RepID=UPI003BAE5567
MKTIRPFNTLLTAMAVSILALGASGASAQDTLRSLTAFPSSDATAALYAEFVELVNERGAGILEIDIVGGPEIVPGFQQTEAVARGTIDMTYAPISYSLGVFPEGDAWVGSNLTPMESRENGGFELVQSIAAEKLGVHVLSRFAPAAPLALYFVDEPKVDADGNLDLSGLRMRASPLYNALYEALGAVPVTISVPDIYSGLERRTFDGMGFPPSAIDGWSWDRFLKYRLDPGFMQTDLGIYINPSKWAALSDESRQILTDTAVEFEATSYELWQQVTEEANAKFEGLGMQVVALEGAGRQAFLDTAFGASWDRLKASGSDDYEALRDHYYREPK